MRLRRWRAHVHHGLHAAVSGELHGELHRLSYARKRYGRVQRARPMRVHVHRESCDLRQQLL
jgi:hypothetical protein